MRPTAGTAAASGPVTSWTPRKGTVTQVWVPTVVTPISTSESELCFALIVTWLSAGSFTFPEAETTVKPKKVAPGPNLSSIEAVFTAPSAGPASARTLAGSAGGPPPVEQAATRIGRRARPTAAAARRMRTIEV